MSSLCARPDNASVQHISGAPPLRLTIDCSDERISPYNSFRSSDQNRNAGLNVESFCSLIHNAIPKAVQDGKFILIEPDSDQEGFSDTQVPISIPPPKGFISSLGLSKLKIPKLRVPKLNVPTLQARVGPRKPPRIESTMRFAPSMIPEEDSSAERMEKLKKGVKKMLHFVKVLGQIDQYLSERIRIVVDKVSKTFAE
ncbi:uncharacterized protein LOC142981854 [Anticarsia gemmatalis]|uniref:uncharacterized protein LOC142981854 n=1 Tax=Anticarsia gemmatalis TaxID=129554 RepID=UPI003F77550F